MHFRSFQTRLIFFFVGLLVLTLAAETPTTANGGISEDLTSITWTLLDGVLWSDGTPLTADDVVFSWEYCIDELTGCVADSFTNVVDVVVDAVTAGGRSALVIVGV